ncbi:MAG: M20/M25/M40 family metallo-hydrolase [Candidatus Sulfomarinibacteraceae bacterium]
MTAMLRPRPLVLLLICALACSTHAFGADSSLVRIHRQPGSDRGPLVDAGVEIVAETNDAWLAIGDPAEVAAAASRFALDTEIIDTEIVPGSLALAGLRGGADESALAACGRVIASGDDWTLVHNPQGFTPSCFASPRFFLRIVDIDPIAAHRPPPVEWAGLADRSATLVPDPLVQEMVDLIDTDVALSHWSALTQSPAWTTRHSSSQGCLDAAAYVHGVFAGAGLQAEYQHHTTGYADNVIGTLPGSIEPDKVYIAIGHLDDLPSSGPAPGADDNASGTAMVTAAAEVMSNYCFARTVKFIAVTGEEQGLHGSDHYADQAAALGEDIQAVLNGDMIGWEGDGQPAVEDLDINYNTGSQWLAQAMVDAAAEYQTGIAVNAFECASMVYSDHAPFWSNGFSAICGITDNEGFCGQGGNYPFYHQSSDTIANCGPGAPDFEAAAIRTYVATLAHLAQPVARIPDAPMGLTAQADGDNRIALAWLPQTPGVTVEVHRAAGGCSNPGPYSLVGQSAGNSFVDTTASGGVPYGYRLVASAASACTSEVSACIDASTTGACTEAPIFAGLEQVTNAAAPDCLLTLEWQPPEQIWCGGPVSYNVYRSTTSGFTPSAANRVATGISTTSWPDPDIFSLRTYHYIVRAVDEANGSEDGNTVEGDGTATGPAVI